MLIDFSQAVSKEQKSYELRNAVKSRLNAEFATAMAALHQGWPDYEIQTWTVQNDEARAWVAASEDDKPTTPFLTSLHDRRVQLGWEEPFADLVARVIANGDAYTAATSSLIAIRHVAERAISVAEDPSSVTWSFHNEPATSA